MGDRVFREDAGDRRRTWASRSGERVAKGRRIEAQPRKGDGGSARRADDVTSRGGLGRQAGNFRPVWPAGNIRQVEGLAGRQRELIETVLAGGPTTLP